MALASARAESAAVSGNDYHVASIVKSTVHLGNIIHAPHDPEQQRREVKEAALRDLRYDGMETRHLQLDQDKLPPDSMDWVWTTDFMSWLPSATERIFWISGKPASGKSTLMHYLKNDIRTQLGLQKRPGQWEILHFFFDFRAGKTLANTLVGMVKTFLHQLIRKLPQDASIASTLFDLQKEGALLQTEIDQLVSTLVDVIRSTPKSLCVFIDGLDEFEGDTTLLLDSIDRIVHRSGIKLCVASRNLSPFTDRFQDAPKIVMQNHNQASILRYIKRAMIPFYGSVVNLDELFNQQLREEVATRAEGVILWARLATDELLKSASDGADAIALKQMLDELPPELESLYIRILNQIDDEIKPESAAVLQLVLECQYTEPSTSLFLGVARLLASTCEDFRILARCSRDTIDGRLSRLLGPLIEIVGTNFRVIRLMHKTLATYLHRTGWAMENVSQQFQTQFPDSLWTRIYTLFIDQATVAKDSKRVTSNLQGIALLDTEAILRGLQDLLFNSEMGSSQSLELEGCLLRSEVVASILGEFAEEVCAHFREIWPDYASPVLKPASKDIVHAIIVGQARYVGKQLRDATDLDTDLKSNLSDFALVDHSTFYGQEYKTSVFATITSLEDSSLKLKGRHICLLMRLLGSLRIKNLRSFSFVSQLISTGATSKEYLYHYPGCVFGAHKEPLLHEWIAIALSEQVRHNWGIDTFRDLFIGCQYFSNETLSIKILQKMFANSPTLAIHKMMYFGAKFVILVQNGLEFPGIEESRHTREIIRKYRRKMIFGQALKARRASDVAKMNRFELDLISNVLQKYEKTGGWNLDILKAHLEVDSAETTSGREATE